MTHIHTNTPKKRVQWLLMTVLFLVAMFVLWPVLRELGYRSGDDAVALRVYKWRDELKLEALEQEYKLPKGLLSAVMHQESAVTHKRRATQAQRVCFSLCSQRLKTWG